MEAASNLGVRSSESTYIAIHDDDDLWDPQFLERTVATLDETGADMCVVRIIERFERQTEDGFIVLNECTFHEDLPAMGLQFLFRTNARFRSACCTAAPCTRRWGILMRNFP